VFGEAVERRERESSGAAEVLSQATSDFKEDEGEDEEELKAMFETAVSTSLDRFATSHSRPRAVCKLLLNPPSAVSCSASCSFSSKTDPVGTVAAVLLSTSRLQFAHDEWRSRGGEGERGRTAEGRRRVAGDGGEVNGSEDSSGRRKGRIFDTFLQDKVC
jgi:hypothetical protein